MKLVGIFQQLSHFVLRRAKFVSEAQTVHSSCSQMFCSDIPVQSDVSVNSSCTGVFIGDMCDGAEHACLWSRRQGKGEGSIDSRPAALGRGTACDDRVGTGQSEFPETPTGSDGRRHLQDSNGSKTLDDDCLHWTSE